MKTLKLLFTLAYITCFPFASLLGQDTFAPDRPGLGIGTYVLQPKITYLENGLEYFGYAAFLIDHSTNIFLKLDL